MHLTFGFHGVLPLCIVDVIVEGKCRKCAFQEMCAALFISLAMAIRMLRVPPGILYEAALGYITMHFHTKDTIFFNSNTKQRPHKHLLYLCILHDFVEKLDDIQMLK